MGFCVGLGGEQRHTRAHNYRTREGIKTVENRTLGGPFDSSPVWIRSSLVWSRHNDVAVEGYMDWNLGSSTSQKGVS
jgi:hypothetical protein